MPKKYDYHILMNMPLSELIAKLDEAEVVKEKLANLGEGITPHVIISNLENTLRNERQQISQLELTLDSVRVRRDDTMVLAAERLGMIKDLRSEKIDVMNQRDKLLGRIRELESQVQILQNELASSPTSHTYRSNFDSLQEKVHQLEAANNSLRITGTEKDRTIGSLRQDYQTLRQSFTAYQADYQNALETRKRKGVQLARTEKALSDLMESSKAALGILATSLLPYEEREAQVERQQKGSTHNELDYAQGAKEYNESLDNDSPDRSYVHGDVSLGRGNLLKGDLLHSDIGLNDHDDMPF